ncbi:atrial natriuretic peptide receptor 3-like [Gigantopelta aegis]|uniref:atrial natriuretic peptide receptor 3-like n=1 Tax=Gigantopelta aegis TaxID=1735272 RepID=UPI001B88D69F|nr:atrial natriuretic peptide receptor 3-like [Gigantopelta aegis]
MWYSVNVLFGCFHACVIFHFLQCAQPSPEVVHIATILPKDVRRRFSIQHVRPSIEVALQHVRDWMLLPGVTVNVRYRDSKCNAKDSPIHAFNFYRRKLVHVFMGPVCDYALAPVSRYAPYWNIPVITAGGFAHNFGSEKIDEFSSLTRIGATFNSLAVSVTAMLQHFNWSRVKLIYDGEGYDDIMPRLCYLLASSLISHRKSMGMEHEFHLYLPAVQTLDYVFHKHIGNDFNKSTSSSSSSYAQTPVARTKAAVLQGAKEFFLQGFI